jgi:glycosyltransferase involved in cell wall biosynthesis
MKHLCFFNTTPFWGGGEKVHLEYAEQFRSKGYQVTVITRSGSPLEKECFERGFEVFTFNIKNLSWLNLSLRQRIAQLLYQLEVDTIFFSDSADLKTGALAARKAGIPRIVYLRALAVPIKSHLVNRYIFSNVVTDIIANSQETAHLAIQYFSKKIQSKTKVIYYGLDLKFIDESPVNQVFNREENTFVIGNIGRLTQQKKQVLLLDLAEKLKRENREILIVVAGTGEMEDELTRAIQERKLTNEVRLLGFVKDIKSFLHQIDLFVLTSEWEGFGYVLAEAMYAEKTGCCVRH